MGASFGFAPPTVLYSFTYGEKLFPYIQSSPVLYSLPTAKIIPLRTTRGNNWAAKTKTHQAHSFLEI